MLGHGYFISVTGRKMWEVAWKTMENRSLFLLTSRGWETSKSQSVLLLGKITLPNIS